MTTAEIDSLIDGVASRIGTQEIRSFVDRKRADLHAMVAAAMASQELPDRPDTAAASAAEPRQPIIIHVRDKKPVTPQLPPPLPMSAYVRPAVQELFDYQLYYKGVFGRNRTEKTGSAVIFKHIPRTAPKSLSDLMPRIREILADPGVSTKPGVDLVLVVKELPIELDRGFEKFLIGSGQELYRGMKSVLPKTE